jgi:hypothetical protein
LSKAAHDHRAGAAGAGDELEGGRAGSSATPAWPHGATRRNDQGTPRRVGREHAVIAKQVGARSGHEDAQLLEQLPRIQEQVRRAVAPADAPARTPVARRSVPSIAPAPAAGARGSDSDGSFWSGSTNVVVTLAACLEDA